MPHASSPSPGVAHSRTGGASSKLPFKNMPSSALGARGPRDAEARLELAQQLRHARQQLPIWAGREAIVKAVREHDTVILMAETGSGKTTQVPQFLHEAGICSEASPLIGITQPRRVAATSLASRVAAEMGEPDPGSVPRVAAGSKRKAAGGTAAAARTLGKVGYAIRFDDRTGPDARLRFMTDGLLLREIMGRREHVVEPGAPSHAMLERYGVVIIDEAHERTVDTDLLLGLVRRIQRARREAYDAWHARAAADSSMDAALAPTLLKVVVMSATLDAQKFASFFAEPRISPQDAPVPAPILYVAGRQFQVDVCHTTEPQADLTAAARQAVFQIHTGLAPGDILVFSTGAEEIESLRAELERLNPVIDAYFEEEGKPGSRLHVVPLYAALGAAAIAKAFEPTPPGCRKVVIATNIAETSITLPGVQYVIDYGLAKERGLTRQGQAGGGSVSSLQALPISQSAADQRTGRAGRVSKGRCFRLYTEAAYQDLSVETVPEILRSDLTDTCLTLYSLGINPLTFDWISMPDKSEVAASTMSLYHLGAVAEPRAERRECGMEITPLGRRMVALPLPAALARMLIAGGEMGPRVARQVRDLVAILSSDRASILHVPSQSSSSVSRTAGAHAGPSDFDRAHEAHAKLAHVSGDHATQLNALYAYLDALQEAKTTVGRMAELGTPDAKGHKSKSNKSALHVHMKAWSRDNWISDRSVMQVMDIRRQLQQLCRASNIVCDDAAAPSMPGTPRNKVARSVAPGTPRSVGTGGASDDDSDDGHPAAGLYVTRGGARGAAGAEQEREDYAELRKCIFLGRSSEYAFKQNDGSYLRPGSDLTFRIHPSSTLMNVKPVAIVFEELVLTTQLYARTVSAIESAWVDEDANPRTRAA